ncbi:hypothetical protein ACFVR1_09850 [Psychrobacillus sp. NPDC058041]
MIQILAYQTTVPLNTFNLGNAFTIPQALFKVILASFQINISTSASRSN